MRLSCEHVGVSYRLGDGTNIEALRDVTLALSPGERVAFVGPNGSGKTTLALCLAGMFPPTVGFMRCEQTSAATTTADGHEGGGHPAGYPRGAIVFQTPEDNLISATVVEEMALTLEHRRETAAETHNARFALDRFGIGELSDRPVEQLSGGEKQKVAVACAFMSGRKMVVLDEPTSHLDPPGRREFFAYLESLGREHTPVPTDRPITLLVTQYEDEARRLERVIQLDGGRVIFDGPSAEWRGMSAGDEPLGRPEIAPGCGGGTILRAESLSQVDLPEWPLPQNGLIDINLEVVAGDAIGLCGPIGAGKTTLAYHLAGLAEKWVGSLEWSGPAATADRPVVLIQFPERQLFCPTVQQDVAYGPLARGIQKEDATARARTALRQIGLPVETYGARSPFALSGGQKRRAAIAGIASLRAPLYILDEPTAALDSEGLRSLAALCDDWRTDGAAVIIVSHDLDTLRQLTDRVWVMNRGTLRYDGTWQDVENLHGVFREIGF